MKHYMSGFSYSVTTGGRVLGTRHGFVCCYVCPSVGPSCKMVRFTFNNDRNDLRRSLCKR